jgi:general secretion pathway protein F/type IV pilus assembly protein PilC
MPEFAYIAKTSTGEKITGTLTAASEREALSILGERALFPLKVDIGKPPRQWASKRVKPQVLATTLMQLGDLLSSGVPMLRSLDVLAKQVSHRGLAEVMADVRAQVADGAPLDVAMSRHPEVFSELTVSMVRAGGEGGFLEDVLKRTAGFIEQQEDLKGRVVGAATYPVLLGIAGFVATTVLIVFFVPKFAEMFARLKEAGELPFVTTGLLWTSDFLGSYGVFLAAAAVGAIVWIRRQIGTDRGRLVWDGMKIKAPLMGPILLNLAVARFCRVLGTLLKNGVPILKSLEISSDSTGNRVLAAAIQDAATNISSGQSLAKPLAACGLFPQAVVEMISVAEESNNLENVLVGIADGIDRRTERQLDLAVRLIEPLMLLVMASVILVVVIALLLPVFQMSATIG